MSPRRRWIRRSQLPTRQAHSNDSVIVVLTMRPLSPMQHRLPLAQRLMVAIVLVCGLLTTASARDSASITAAVDSSSVTLGDPVLFSLTMRYQSDQRPDLVSPPAIDVDVVITPLEPIGPGADVDGFFEQVLSWELRFFELGDHQISPVKVTLVADSGATQTLQSAAVAVRVGSVRAVADAELLEDIKPPVAISGGVPLWLAVVAGVLSLIIVLALVRWVLNRRQRSHEIAVRPQKPIDYVVEFKKIARMGLVERKAFLVYYTLLSETLRRFLEDKVGIEAMERTTEEVVDALRHLSVDPINSRRIEDFLALADLVKFACAEPVVDQALRAPLLGEEIVRGVESALVHKEETAIAMAAASNDSAATADQSSAAQDRDVQESTGASATAHVGG